jgi:hypothetical protein
MKILLVILALTNNVFAGDIVKKGEILKEDSYVFTIPAAESLMSRVFELEKKEKELDHYKQLNFLNNQKIEIYESNINLYKKINLENEKIISNYAELDKARIKNKRWDRFENYIIFGTGVATTVFMFIAIDYINDNTIID